MSSIKSTVKRPDDTWEQLMVLRAATATTGVLHEAQVMQMRRWGPLAFQHADEIEFAVGIYDDEKTKVKTRLVEYRVKATKPAAKNMPKLMAGLCRSVKALLGPEFTVVVKVNGKAIFEEKGAGSGRSRKNASRRTRK